MENSAEIEKSAITGGDEKSVRESQCSQKQGVPP